MKYLPILLIVLLSLPGCKEEDSPVESVGNLLGNITGIITDSETGNVIPQVLVTTQNSTSSVITDIDGVFFIENVSPGNYTLVAEKAEYVVSQVSVRVDSGLTTTADIVLTKEKDPESGILEGQVINASDDSGIETAVVTITSEDESNSINLTKISDTNGNYQFLDIPPGNYAVSASKFDYVTKTININIIADSTSFAAIQLVPKYGIIEGTVTDKATNLPIEGALISTTPATNTVTTDSEGKYKIDYAPTATGVSVNYTISAVKDGYTDASVQVNVNPGRTTTANIQM